MNFKRLLAVLGVALGGMCASPAQAEGGDFEYTFGAGCNEETGVLDYMITDIANNTSAAVEVVVILDGETVVTQLLNPGDTMPDVIRPFPFLGLVELWLVDPTGVEEDSQQHTAYYSVFHSCVDPVITFEEHGGDEVTDPQCVDGEQFEIPAAPTRDGYTFTSWNSAADGTGTAYEVGSMHDCLGLITIHATWAAEELPLGELPATGTDQPKWPILLLIAAGSSLLWISRRPRTAPEIIELH